MTPPTSDPLAASFETLIHAVLREEWRVDLSPGGPPDGSLHGALVGAAAALGAGEPRRAMRLLDTAAPDADPDVTEVSRAFRGCATMLDTGWFPGGGSGAREPGRLPDLPVVPNPQRATGRQARVLVTLAWRFLGALPGWRGIVTNADLAPAALDLAQQMLAELLALDEARATAPAALALADLLARSGRPAEAASLLETARALYGALDDAVGMASCALSAGDWAAAGGAVGLHPETLLERLDGVDATAAVPDLAAAQAQWAEAESTYEAVGSGRGLAAVALRRAAVAVLDGDPGAAVPLLDRAVDLAGAAADGALARLAEVHRALALVAAGERPDGTAIGAAVAAWSLADGSRSYARGLARLCAARSARWRDGDVARSRLALRLAEAVTTPLGAAPEVALLRTGEAARYQATGFSRAAFLLVDADLDDARQAGDVGDGPAWGKLVEGVATASPLAQRLRSGRFAQRVGEYASWLLDTPPQGSMAQVTAAASDPVLHDMRTEAAVFGPLHRAVALRDRGEADRAAPLFDTALEAAKDNIAYTLAVLFARGGREEAVALVEPLLAELPVALLLRLGRPDLAKKAVAGLPDGLPEGFPKERPWEAVGAKAEIQLGTDDPAAAAATAATALELVEKRIGELGIDVFRTMASDDLTVAGIYTTAVRAHTRAAADPTSAADPDVARGFELSDRCRAGALTDLLARSAPTDGSAAVRSWQATGARLGETADRLADDLEERIAHLDGPPPAYDVRQELAGVERALDEAEEALAATAPNELAARRRLPATPTLSAVRGRLAPGTLLLQYHAFDDELICWAVTADSARVVRQSAPTAALREEAWRWHQALARASSDPDDLDRMGTGLAARLLAPWADELADHRRLVVVPHGPLSMLPFHALPWDGSPLGAREQPWTLSMIPTVSLLLPEPPAGPFATGTEVLVLGDPAYAADRRLPPLEGTRFEAQAVGRLRGTEPLLGAAATHEAVMAALPGSRVVHLATHGTLREGSPFRSELALAGTDSLTVADLVGAETAVDLAVLSACDSGRGTATAAGDLIGLTRALLAAGARELVVSLWPVDDVLACLTMVALHENLRAGETVSAALQRAQARVRALTRDDAAAWYRELAPDAEPTPGTRRTTRDLSDEEPAGKPADSLDPAHPCAWAPFVHVGVS